MSLVVTIKMVVRLKLVIIWNFILVLIYFTDLKITLDLERVYFIFQMLTADTGTLVQKL